MGFRELAIVFIKELVGFEHGLSSIDLTWDVIFPGQNKKWHRVTVIKYKNTFFINHLDGKSCSLEVTNFGKME